MKVHFVLDWEDGSSEVRDYDRCNGKVQFSSPTVVEMYLEAMGREVGPGREVL